MKKNKKLVRPKFLSFAKTINEKSVNTGLRYIEAYEDMITKINFDRNFIYSIKELPFSKRNIKIAYKRLLFFHDYRDKKIFKAIRMYFPIIANFQNHKTKYFHRSSVKIQKLYKEEFVGIIDALDKFEEDVLPAIKKGMKKRKKGS